ncbi:MAG TPA: HlyD family secretion protein [Methylocystis sp.]|nr:HlyD family secretion protein [Methylocystis sp.]
MTGEKVDAQGIESDSPAAEPAPSQEARAEKPQKEPRKPLASQPPPLWPLGVAAIFAAFFGALVLWIIFRPRPDVWTDDAYVTAHFALIAPRVSGQVVAVEVDDNQQVKTGQRLVTLDPRDYENAVATALAAVERDRAQIADASATLARQPPIIEEQEGNVAAARARLTFAEHDAHRFGNLALTGAGTVQQQQQADTTLQQSRAQLQSALAALDAARKQIDVIKAQQQTAKAAIMADEARLAQAKLDLSYTRIAAPIDGMVGQRAVQVGNVIAPGATLMAVVPLDQAYIVANYREVDLLHVRSGQKVTIRVDAYRIDLNGTVDSLAPASGASFAPIQPNNATGNFTKIVQRLPVKITVDPNQPLAKLLRVGFSVETTIHTELEDVVNEQRRSSSRVTER